MEFEEKIRAVLECPCCSKILESPLLFNNCGHSFCSVCIRRWLQTKLCCPLCNMEQDESNLISNVSLNQILEILNGTESNSKKTQTQHSEGSGLARIPSVAYHVVSESKLDEILKGFGLPTTGTKESKINLHREYSLLYNSKIDSGATNIDTAEVRKKVLAARISQAKASIFAPSSSSSSIASSSLKTKKSIDFHIRKARKRAQAKERKKWKGAVVETKWRAVFSDFLNKPVYYNSETNECTIERPVDLESDEIEDGVVIVVDS